MTPLEEVLSNLPDADWGMVTAEAGTQARSSQPSYKSNGLEEKTFRGYFFANASTTKIAILSDDGANVTIDGVAVHSGKGTGQHLPNLTQSLHSINYDFEAGGVYLIEIAYSNIQFTSASDIDGVTLFAYGGGGEIIEAIEPIVDIGS